MGNKVKQSLPLCYLGATRPPNAGDNFAKGFSLGSIWTWGEKTYNCTGDGIWELGGGSLTQASQAQVEAAFDNTDQTTPVVLEQTSTLTPFNAWWLVQKIKAWVRAGFTLTGALNFAPSVALTGATPAIGAANSNNITITSTTTITGFDTIAEGAIRRVKFSAITTLTHSASLDLPTSANITTAVGDEAVFMSLGGGNWKCISYTRKDGTALAEQVGVAYNTYVNTQDKKFNFKLSFNGVRVIEDYWIDAGTVSAPTISAGLTVLEYALVTEASYSSSYPVTIPANTRVFWRCTFSTNSFTGSANLKGSYTNNI